MSWIMWMCMLKRGQCNNAISVQTFPNGRTEKFGESTKMFQCCLDQPVETIALCDVRVLMEPVFKRLNGVIKMLQGYFGSSTA